MRRPAFATRNLRLKALAVALAAIMWTGVAYASNPPDTRSVSVKVPQDAPAIAPYVLVHPIPNLVVRVSGTREHLAAFDPGDLIVTVDYKVISHVGVQTVPVSVVNNDRDVILESPPPGITVEVDRLDSRTVSVTVDTNPLPPQGYVVVSSSTNPSTVTVIGPHNQLAGVEARVTVNLTNQKTNFQAEEQVSVVDSHQQPLNLEVTIAGHPQGGVLVTILIAPSLTSRPSAVLPKIGSPPSGHLIGAVSVSPTTALLTGPQDLLNNLDSVATQTISLSGVTGTASFTVKLVPPAGVTATPGTVTVTVTVIPQPSPSPSPSPTPSPTH